MRVEAFVVGIDGDDDRAGRSADDHRLDDDADELLVCEFERTVLSLKRENAAD